MKASYQVRATRCLMVLVIVTMAVAVLCAAAFAQTRQVVVGQPRFLTNYQMLVGTAPYEVITLQGTAKMRDGVIGDMDADGLENDLVYRDAYTGRIGWYKIPGDGAWHPENDHVNIPRIAYNCVPHAVVQTGVPGTVPSLIHWNPASFGMFSVPATGSSSPALFRINGTSRVFRAWQFDGRGLGYKGDLYCQTYGYGWKEGLNGASHMGDANMLLGVGVGNIIPDMPANTIVYLNKIDSQLHATDPSYMTDVTVQGAAWPNVVWSYSSYSMRIGDVDGDGVSEIIWVPWAGAGVHWYKVANGGGTGWDESRHFMQNGDGSGDGWLLAGVASVDNLTPEQIVPVMKIGELKDIALGTVVKLTGKVLTAPVRDLNTTTNVMWTSGCYIEEPDRAAGIRVTMPNSTLNAMIGQTVDVIGRLTDDNGEIIIAGSDLTPTAMETWAQNADGSQLLGPAGIMDIAMSGDVRNSGCQGDLLYKNPGQSMYWKNGLSGDILMDMGQPSDYLNGAGYIVRDKPEFRFLYGSTGDSSLYLKSVDGLSKLRLMSVWASSTKTGLVDLDEDGLLEVVQYDPSRGAVATYDFPNDSNGTQATAVGSNWSPTWPWSKFYGATLLSDGSANYPVGIGKDITAPGNLKLYYFWPGLMALTATLPDTYDCENCVIGDCDGDGQMDEIIFNDVTTGRVGYFTVTGTLTPDEEFQAQAGPITWIPNCYGSPQAVVNLNAGSWGQVVYKRSYPIKPVGTTVKNINSGLPMTGLLVRLAGKVTQVDPAETPKWFVLDDGSPSPITVYAPTVSVTQGKLVTVTGNVGALRSGDVYPIIRVSDRKHIVTVN